MNLDDIMKEENVKKMIQESQIIIMNCCIEYKRVQKFVILDTDFSVPGGELTESKLKRKNQAESMYQLTSEV